VSAGEAVILFLSIGLWLVFCALVGYVGNQRGRDGIGLFVMSILISPLIGYFVAVGLPAREVAPKVPGEVASSAWPPEIIAVLVLAALACVFGFIVVGIKA